MTPTLLLTRPYEDSLRTARDLEALGIHTCIAPALNIHYLHDAVEHFRKQLEAGAYEAILMTSQHASPMIGENLAYLGQLPLYIVGEHTEKQLRHVGCENDTHTYPTAAQLAENVAKLPLNRFAYLRGQFVKQSLVNYLREYHKTVEELVAYDAKEVAHISEEGLKALNENALDAVCFYSERSAAIFSQWINKLALEEKLTSLDALCLSPGVAEQVKALLPFRTTLAPDFPSQSAFLHVIEQWQQTRC